MTQLTEHFTVEELAASSTAAANGIDNTPDDAALEELQWLAEALEDVRTLLGDVPIIITSGYRCPQLNTAVGGATDSAHLYGRAADFIAPDFGTPREVCLMLQDYVASLRVDQLIYECGCDGEGDEWVHIGIAAQDAEPRCQCLTIDSSGTTTGIA